MSTNDNDINSQNGTTLNPTQTRNTNNISITDIKCNNSVNNEKETRLYQQNYSEFLNTMTTPIAEANGINSNGSIQISVPKIEDSDESESELTNIEQSCKVNRRTANSNIKNGPRPMSWEGELSDQESHMEIDQLKHKLKTTETTVFKTCPDEIKQEFDSTLAIATNLNLKKFQHQNDLMNMKYEQIGFPDPGGINSPLLARSKISQSLLPANPSPDSAIHSAYTPSQSPLTSRHPPYNTSLSRNNSDASHSSCYSYSSEFSPTHSPIQARHNIYASTNGSNPAVHLYRPLLDDNLTRRNESTDILVENDSSGIPSPGISRQQLINSPCPICGDKISGFHYGIFSCESCKGFFKRTVQNRKNYVCVRGGPCSVTTSTRKKCPACRFDKCLQKGMKLEAIREDRTRGGRSTYQCSYSLPNPLALNSITDSTNTVNSGATASTAGLLELNSRVNGCVNKMDETGAGSTSIAGSGSLITMTNQRSVPALLQEIMDVEHLWQYNESELSRLNQPLTQSQTDSQNLTTTNPLLAGLTDGEENTNPDLIATICNVADHRLYKIVKWCKSLPLFKNISIDDQICLLINSWCELLLFSCCFRSITTPGEIKISLGKTITLEQAKSNVLQMCVERMLNLTDHLRRLRVDSYEYVALKVIILLQSDTSELREPVKVRECQEKALQALQSYTLAYYPEMPSKFGELLLRIPELQRTCQLGKAVLTIKSKDGEDFNLLMELLRGEH